MAALLAGLSASEESSIEGAVLGLVLVVIIAAVAFFGIRAAGEPVWATRVAAVLLGLGCLLVLLAVL